MKTRRAAEPGHRAPNGVVRGSKRDNLHWASPRNGTTCPAPSVLAEETYSLAIAFPTAQALVVTDMQAMTTALRAKPD